MYKIVKVGIPIQTRYISQDFFNIIKEIKTGNSIGVTTVDYFDNVEDNFKFNTETISSPAGHKVIFDNIKIHRYNGKFIPNVINSVGYIWKTADRSDKTKIIENLLKIIDKEYETLNFDKVYIFSTGSPYFMDIFTEELQKYKDIDVIDTKCSFSICKESMFDILGYAPETIIRRYNHEFILKNNPEIDLNKLNIFSCISNNYNFGTEIPLVEHFFKTMNTLVKPTDTFMYSNVNDEVVKTVKIQYSQAETIYSNLNKDVPLIIGIHKGET